MFAEDETVLFEGDFFFFSGSLEMVNLVISNIKVLNDEDN